jgi:hypothetical protein
MQNEWPRIIFFVWGMSFCANQRQQRHEETVTSKLTPHVHSSLGTKYAGTTEMNPWRNVDKIRDGLDEKLQSLHRSF